MFEAVTLMRRNVPASAVTGVYEVVLAPEIAAQRARSTALGHFCHWYDRSGVGLPSQVPTPATVATPTTGLPVTSGALVFTGAKPINGEVAEVAVIAPARFDARTVART
jgi:hypothetical protein